MVPLATIYIQSDDIFETGQDGGLTWIMAICRLRLHNNLIIVIISIIGKFIWLQSHFVTAV
jgi:hypothetical protein